jgi:hypothetical protein
MLDSKSKKTLQLQKLLSTQILGQNLDMAFSKMCLKSVPVGDKNKAVIERILKSMAEQNALRRDHACLPPIHLQQSTQATSARARVLTSDDTIVFHSSSYGANVPTWMLSLT